MDYRVYLTEKGREVQANSGVLSFTWPERVEAVDRSHAQQEARFLARVVWDNGGRGAPVVGEGVAPADDWFHLVPVEPVNE